MAPGIVYENVAEGADLETGALFEGRKFYVVQRVPNRAALLDAIKANGGFIVQLEKQADWMIADHFRRDCPPGSISYDFVQKSIAKGEVLDPDNFPAGPQLGTARDPGSLVRPAKSTRAHFTADEDRILYKWAKDAQVSGVRVGGNEIYKQFETQHPQHPWQSWRDRYLKKLQHMPASAFTTPENAPPSPPADHSRVVEPPVGRGAGLVKNKDKARAAASEKQTASVGASTSKRPTTKVEKIAGREQFTVDQLKATFTKEDWEDLYAFVEDIDSHSKEDESYDAAWADFAASKDNQTPEQWRQYYEKVVRPQWLSDPVSKRQQIREKVEARHQDTSSSPVKSQSWSQVQDDDVKSQTIASPAPSPKRTVSNILPSDSRLASESTAQQETPKYIRDGYERALKRIRGEADNVPEADVSSRPVKTRRKMSFSPTLIDPEEPMGLVGTHEQPLEVSSVGSQSEFSEQDESDEQSQSQSRAQADGEETEDEEEEEVASDTSYDDYVKSIGPLPPPAYATDDDNDDDDESTTSSTDFVRIAPIPRPPRIPEDDDDEEDNDNEEDEDESLPSNDPTPRAPRHTAFDTQAILTTSSHHLTALPLPPTSSSPPHHPDSDVSTTQSLQEFSSYLRAADDLSTPLHPRPSSPTPSTASHSSSSTAASTPSNAPDPDPPLTARALDAFYSTQSRAGFTPAFTTAALKRTRCRPRLAQAVLAAWREGAALPVRRGVWSAEEDEVVVRGDGAALVALRERHTMDGWGGITERVRFLEAWGGQ
ncbi:hypothetical protein C7974DRAFT_453630 [Boeremia exigua]|uniref:uncharacterized protein n=1 Tax=Boeremia exigua TaxID=749465 RepID=UPI001E8D4079|nr:uncharacterized protein C7974DRAFT_453630 [Boeremia exigua]KAH6629075.1 hypothetical protein C7974DRAFT_453630 [Boeremia exigua]